MLSLSIFAPLAGAILIGLIPVQSHGEGKKNKPKGLLFFIALLASLVSLFASISVAFDFNPGIIPFQMQEAWLEHSGNWLQWSYGIDHLNLSLYLLTTLLFPIGICSSYSSFIMKPSQTIPKEKLFWISLLVLESSVVGVFLATNLIAFYIFWELMLAPMVLLIGIWGGENRRYAAIKFFVYTFAGSVFLILGIIALAIQTPNSELAFEIGYIVNTRLDRIDISIRRLIFWGFLFSFLIKIPAIPFHTWLPHAHTQAPTVGSVILAGVLLKMGSYGIFRFSLGMFPKISNEFSFLFMLVGTTGIIYGAWLAWSQNDIKKLVAYSSVSHMGYILAGAFTGNHEGISGAYIQMINHGISTGLLFLMIGMLYDRTHTRDIEAYQGLAKLSPAFSLFFMIATLSSIGFPGTNGFIGEFLVLLGIYLKEPIVAYFAVTGVIFGAVYMLHLYKKVFFGPPSAKLLALADEGVLKLKNREIFIIMPFIIMIFWLGLKPGFILSSTQAGIEKLVFRGVTETLTKNSQPNDEKPINAKTTPKDDTESDIDKSQEPSQ